MKNILFGIGLGVLLYKFNQSSIGKLEDYEFPSSGRVDRYWKGKLDPDNFTGRKVQFTEYSVQEVVNKFGLKGIEFGNWMNQNQRQSFLNNFVVAFQDLAKILNVPMHNLGMNNKLSIAFGARGTSRAMAHYEAKHYVINLTKTTGMFGVLAHEFGHYIDHIVGYKISKTNTLATRILNHNSPIISEYLNLFDNLYFHPDGSLTEYAKEQNKRSAYYKSRPEVFARSIEVFIYSRLKAKKIVNEFLQEYPDYTTPPINLVMKSRSSISKIINFALK